MASRFHAALLPLTGFCLLLAACDAEEEQQVLDNIRSIKTITITDLASGQLRRFPGTVQAVDTSYLSFEVAGNTRDVMVSAGERVKEGDVLANLDDRPFQIDVEGAEASLGQAKADLAERLTEYNRQLTLYQKGWVAKAAYDQALAAKESAEGQVAYAQSRVNLAQRDLEKTTLVAPFDGVIAARDIEPFQEVARGERVFELYAEGAMEVAVSIPETSISSIFLGQKANVSFPSSTIGTLDGRVSEIGTSASENNAFTIKVALIDAPPAALPGMTAEVQMLLGGEEESAFLLPLTAIVPGENRGEGYVFIFDPQSGTVHRTAVSGSSVQDNQVLISKGLEAGDIVAVAGASFLRDGQRVKLLGP